MKHYIPHLLLALLLPLCCASCDDTKTYADMLEEEEDMINSFISSRGLNILSENGFDPSRKMGEKDYVLFTADGVYQCLQRKKKRQMESEDLGPRLQALTQGGAECVASYSCLEARGIEINEVCSGVRVVTLEEIARLMGQVDQVVCL